MQFINIAVVVMCINFDFTKGDKLFLGFIPIFNGDYPDFSVNWYSNVGKTLCMTLLVQIFSPYMAKLVAPILSWIFRAIDRGGFNVPLKKEKPDADGTDVNTKKLLQDELNQLYTGE